MGRQSLDSKKLDILEALRKGFVITFSARHHSHSHNMTLMRLSKRPSLFGIFTLCLSICPSLACHFTYLELDSKYEAKEKDELL